MASVAIYQHDFLERRYPKVSPKLGFNLHQSMPELKHSHSAGCISPSSDMQRVLRVNTVNFDDHPRSSDFSAHDLNSPMTSPRPDESAALVSDGLLSPGASPNLKCLKRGLLLEPPPMNLDFTSLSLEEDNFCSPTGTPRACLSTSLTSSPTTWEMPCAFSSELSASTSTGIPSSIASARSSESQEVSDNIRVANDITTSYPSFLNDAAEWSGSYWDGSSHSGMGQNFLLNSNEAQLYAAGSVSPDYMNQTQIPCNTGYQHLQTQGFSHIAPRNLHTLHLATALERPTAIPVPVSQHAVSKKMRNSLNIPTLSVETAGQMSMATITSEMQQQAKGMINVFNEAKQSSAPTRSDANSSPSLPTLLSRLGQQSRSEKPLPVLKASQCSRAQTAQTPVGDANGEAGPEMAKREVSTLMIRNLPTHITQVDFIKELDKDGFAGTYDFAYLPQSFNTNVNSGFGFINFIDPCMAGVLVGRWHRQHRFGKTGKSGLSISPADVQGRDANIRKWMTPRLRKMKNPQYRPFILGDVAESPKEC